MIGLGHSLSLAASKPLVPPFVGPLDAYAADSLALWGLSYRLLTSYQGALFRVRRTGDDEMDIAAKSNGLFDIAALNGFVGADPWWFSQFYDQTGNGIHLTYPASGQPRGAVDENELVHAYAETGPNDKAMASAALSVAATDTTHWTVGSSPSYATYGVKLYDGLRDVQRASANAANTIYVDMNDPLTGTYASIGANTGLYSLMMQVGADGNRLNIGTAVGTGTRASSAITIQQVSVGGLYAGWNPLWAANATFYGGGLWVADLGNANADAIQAIGKELYFTQ